MEGSRFISIRMQGYGGVSSAKEVGNKKIIKGLWELRRGGQPQGERKQAGNIVTGQRSKVPSWPGSEEKEETGKRKNGVSR